jgi:hypothetical protein
MRQKIKMFGKRKTIPLRGVEMARDKGEFRPGLYDRDLQELREALHTLGQKMDAVLDNQVKLDELMRKVGLVVERDARAVQKTLETVVELEKMTAELIKNVGSLPQLVAGVKDEVTDVVGEKLDEAVNQLVAGQQDIVGWLRRKTDRPGHELNGKDGAPLTEEGRRSGIAEKRVAVELRQVISMIVAGETARAVETLSAIYSRLDPTTGSEEKPHEVSVAGDGIRKRTAGLRTSWQDTKSDSSCAKSPEVKSIVGQKDSRVVEESKATKDEGESNNS